MRQPVLTTRRLQIGGRSPLSCVLPWCLAFLMAMGLTACNRPTARLDAASIVREYPQAHGALVEVAPPQVLTELRTSLDRRQPQVSILTPKPNQILSGTTVNVRLEVRDLPLFRNAELDLGPHLHLLLDNQFYQAVYDVSQPIPIENLTPGTHTLRAFAVRPWHESFKNDGAYAQVSFSVFTPSPENQPIDKAPLLTYSWPKGSFGAEPILLDFYLTHAPLHALASQHADAAPDWKIRVTVNGESFLLDTWEPIWLEGFRPGQNWLKTELLDSQGRPLETPFNTTVRLIEYQPGGKDVLSQVVRGELSATSILGMVDASYQPSPESAAIRSQDERDIAKDKEDALDSSPAPIPQRSLASPRSLNDANQQPREAGQAATKDRVEPPLPDQIGEEKASADVERPAAGVVLDPTFPAETQSVSPANSGDGSSPLSQKQEQTGGRRQAVGSEGLNQTQMLQQRFSHYWQQFRRQPAKAANPKSSSVKAPLPASPSALPSPLPADLTSPALPPSTTSDADTPSREAAVAPPAEVVPIPDSPEPAPSAPDQRPANAVDIPDNPEPSLLDQATDQAGSLLQRMGHQSQVQSQKLKRQFTNYLQRFRRPVPPSGSATAVPTPAAAEPAVQDESVPLLASPDELNLARPDFSDQEQMQPD
jgi:hypothetical protein